MITRLDSIKSYVNSMMDELKEAAPSNTGSLSDSIQFDIQVDESGYNVGIAMYDWGIYLDKGVNGVKQNFGSPFTFKKMPPPSSLDKWIVSKGLAPRDAKGRLMTRDQIKFLIARSIFQNGLRPRNWINPILDSKLEGLANLTADEIWYELSELSKEQGDLNIKIKL